MSEEQRKPTPIKNILQGLSRKNPIISKGAVMAKLEKDWQEIIGENLARQCLPETIQNKTLWVSVTNATWAQQLHFYKEQLVDKINGAFYKRIIENIRYRTGRPKQAVPMKPVLAEEDEPQAPPPEEELSGIEDQSLRQRIFSLWTKSRRFFKRGKNKKRTCKKCNTPYRGTNPNICIFCEDTLSQGKKSRVASLLREVPWASFASLNKELKSIGEANFLDIKEKIRRTKYDRLRRAIFSFLDDPRSQRKEGLLRQILEYVSLRSGLTPDKINDKIIQEVIGSRKARLLKKKGVKI